MSLLDLLCEGKAVNEDTGEMENGDVISADHVKEGGLGGLLLKVSHRSKVKKVAILDLDGNVEHVTSGWNVTSVDCAKLIQVLNAAPTKVAWKMDIFGELFTCFNSNGDGTVVGNGMSKVWVGHVTGNHIVVGLADGQGSPSGSCLREIQQLCKTIEEKNL